MYSSGTFSVFTRLCKPSPPCKLRMFSGYNLIGFIRFIENFLEEVPGSLVLVALGVVLV